MAATVTEIAQAHSTVSATSLTSPAVSGAPQVGDTVVVVCTDDNSNALASGNITDLAGNSYTLAHGASFNAGTRHVGVWFTLVTAAFTNGTTTVKFTTGGSGRKTIQVLWCQGLVTVSPLDVSNSNPTQATATPSTGASGVLAQADELAIAAYGYEQVGGVPSFTVPAGWSNAGLTTQIFTTSLVHSVAYLETNATTSLNPTCTLGASQNDAGVIATFKVAAVTAVAGVNAKGRRRRRIGLTRRRTVPFGAVFLANLLSPLCPGTSQLSAVRRRHPTIKRRRRPTQGVAFAVRNSAAAGAKPFVPAPASVRRRPVRPRAQHRKIRFTRGALPIFFPNPPFPNGVVHPVRRRIVLKRHHRPAVQGVAFAVRNTVVVASVTPERTKMGVGL